MVEEPRSNNPAAGLSQPLYGASMGQAIGRFFKKYVRFKGYASRSEYWWVALAQFILYLVLAGAYIAVFSTLAGSSPDMQQSNADWAVEYQFEGGAAVVVFLAGLINFVVSLGLLIPTLALTWRRLHDAGFPGPLYFLTFVPFFGPLVLLVLTIMPTRTDRHRSIWDDPHHD